MNALRTVLFLTLAVFASAPAFAKTQAHKPPAKPAAHKVAVHKIVAAKPAPPPAPDTDVPMVKDMSGAIPATQAAKLPSTAEQFKTLKTQIAKTRPAVATAKQKSDALKAEAAALRAQLIVTAARVQFLEEEKGQIDADLVRLTAEEESLSSDFARDRVQVAHLLAVMERLQQDMPPALAMRPDDALGAARASMVLGASLPHVYGAAAALSRKLALLRKTRADLIIRRAQSAKNAIQLSSARVELDQLLAMKSREADAAAAQYGDLQARLDAAADQAANLGSLLEKVAALRAAPVGGGITVVTAANIAPPRRAPMIRPVVGAMTQGGGEEGAHAPGLSFLLQHRRRRLFPPPIAGFFSPAVTIRRAKS